MDTGLFDISCGSYSEILERHFCPNIRRVDASYFLHGICGIFAFALHQVKGWPIVSLYNPDEDKFDYAPNDFLFPVVHLFCAPRLGLFADCRGITDSEERFVEEFEDFFTEPAYYEFQEWDYKPFWESARRAMGDDVDALLAFALDYIQMNADYFKA